MTVVVTYRPRIANAAAVTLPLTAENLITALAESTEFFPVVSIIWQGGPTDTFTLHNLTDLDCRFLRGGNRDHMARAMIADLAKKYQASIGPEIERLAA